jgi:TPP-dependent pyruvate/acetoin dehydrogenase alpha subunit
MSLKENDIYYETKKEAEEEMKDTMTRFDEMRITENMNAYIDWAEGGEEEFENKIKQFIQEEIKFALESQRKEIREWMNRRDFPDIAWKIKLENLLNSIK